MDPAALLKQDFPSEAYEDDDDVEEVIEEYSDHYTIQSSHQDEGETQDDYRDAGVESSDILLQSSRAQQKQRSSASHQPVVQQ